MRPDIDIYSRIHSNGGTDPRPLLLADGEVLPREKEIEIATTSPANPIRAAGTSHRSPEVEPISALNTPNTPIPEPTGVSVVSCTVTTAPSTGNGVNGMRISISGPRAYFRVHEAGTTLVS